MRYVFLAIAVSFAASVNAQTAAAVAQRGAVTSLEGRQFGQHVSGMAPEHPRMHGRLLGECVSEMAITGECPHHQDE